MNPTGAEELSSRKAIIPLLAFRYIRVTIWVRYGDKRPVDDFSILILPGAGDRSVDRCAISRSSGNRRQTRDKSDAALFLCIFNRSNEQLRQHRGENRL
jgi:hypothetical protein